MILAQKCLCNDQSHKQVWTSLNMFGVQSDLTRSKFWIDLEIHHFCCCFLTKKFSILKISRFESCFFPYSFFSLFYPVKTRYLTVSPTGRSKLVKKIRQSTTRSDDEFQTIELCVVVLWFRGTKHFPACVLSAVLATRQLPDRPNRK